MNYLNSAFDGAKKTATKPTVVQFILTDLYKLQTTVYAIVGTTYGHVHTSSGDVRYWKTRNGARRWIRENYPTSLN